MNTMKRHCCAKVLASATMLLFAAIGMAYAASDTDCVADDRSVSSSGFLLPARAEPQGYSLADMAKATAAFNVTTDQSGNHTGAVPDLVDGTPFQELYTTATNKFEVKSGTVLYVPVYQNTSSPPVVGDFPADVTKRKALLGYTFSHKQLGFEYAKIRIDESEFLLDERYLVGVHVSALPDGGGTQYMNFAAFVVLKKKGRHIVAISARLTGEAVLQATGGSPLDFTLAYEVTVK